jgi:drug/metabolite transporter (DMT)-like permease
MGIMFERKEEMGRLLLAYIILCSIFGTTFLAVKIGINAGFAPFMYAGVRFLIAGLIIVTYAHSQGLLRSLKSMDWRDIAAVGVAMTTVKFAALYWALQYIPSGTSALLVAVFPIMVMLAGYLMERTQISRLQRIGLALGLFGVFLIVNPTGIHGNGWILGAGAIMIGEFVNALGAVYSRRIFSRGIPPVVLNGIQMVVGSIGLILMSVLWENSPFPAEHMLTGWGALIYLVVFGSIIGAGIYYWLIKMINPLIPSTWSYVSPVIAMMVGVVVLNETITARGLFGAVVVITGVVLTNFEAFSNIIRSGRIARQG